jgi:acetyl/propionyl-CoA carboxylase alpha subunit
MPTIGTATAASPFYLAYDQDDPDTANVAAVSTVTDYAGYKAVDFRKPWFFRIKPAVTSSSSTAVQISKGGWYDFAAPPVMGAVLAFAASAGSSVYLGDLVLTMEIMCRGLR